MIPSVFTEELEEMSEQKIREKYIQPYLTEKQEEVVRELFRKDIDKTPDQFTEQDRQDYRDMGMRVPKRK